MDHLIRKVIFDAEYFQPGVAVYLETEETKQQGFHKYFLLFNAYLD